MATLTVNGVSHRVDGTQVAIIADGQVLVQFRPLPPGWELPGGHCEPGEDPAVCAVREAGEETGLDVRIVGAVGLYRWSGLRRAREVVYAAEVVGGRRHRTLEGWASRYVDASCLPRALFPWYRQRVVDALAFTPGDELLQREQRTGPVQVLLFGLAWLRTPVDFVGRRLRPLRR